MYFILAFLLFPVLTDERMLGCSAGICLNFRRQTATESPPHRHVQGDGGTA
jgi:hypothetical protein